MNFKWCCAFARWGQARRLSLARRARRHSSPWPRDSCGPHFSPTSPPNYPRPSKLILSFILVGNQSIRCYFLCDEAGIAFLILGGHSDQEEEEPLGPWSSSTSTPSIPASGSSGTPSVGSKFFEVAILVATASWLFWMASSRALRPLLFFSWGNQKKKK